jgi:hypothetical protein
MKIKLLVVVVVVFSETLRQSGGGDVEWWTAQMRLNCRCTLFLSRVFSCSRDEFLLRKIFNEVANA